MSDLRQAAQQALDFIFATNKSSQFWLVPESNLNKTVTALRAALAAAVAEPVAWQYREANADGTWSAWVGCDKPLAADAWRQVRALYTAPAAPPQREREPLTDEQLWASDEIMSLNADLGWHMDTIRMFARAIERAHGIKEQP